MIIKALCDYYDRKAALPDSGIAPPGWEWKEIPFVVVIDHDGKFVQIDDLREGEGKKKRGKKYLVPQWVGRTSGVAANLLCDKVSYVFGVGPEDEAERLETQRKAFLQRQLSRFSGIPEAEALLNFIAKPDLGSLGKESCWKNVVDTDQVISFRYADEPELVFELPAFKHAVDGAVADAEPMPIGRCLVTGQQGPICRLHEPKVKGVRGTKSSGATLVSFNDDYVNSYGKNRGLNAPMVDETVFKYTTALNSLLDWNSRQKIHLGGSTVVFWSFEDTSFENEFASLLAEPQRDDPDVGTEVLDRLLKSPLTGWYRAEEDDKLFCYLVLSPNAARISVRQWNISTIGELSARIRQYFQDLIVVGAPDPRRYRLDRILQSVYCREDRDFVLPSQRDGNVPNYMEGALLQAALTGSPIPLPLVKTALARLHGHKKSRDIPCLVAIVKAWLNRHLSLYTNPNSKEISMELDTSQPSVGYQLGRLFAVLERVQERASGGSLNSTIRERFYGSACATPVTVFANLLRLKNHHLAKMASKGLVVYFERLIGEIVGHISEFPPHLDLQEQGRFAIGYYHQRQAFFAGKTPEPESEEHQE